MQLYCVLSGFRKPELVMDAVIHLPLLETAYVNTKNAGKTFLFDYTAFSESSGATFKF